jgi:PIN domain nuclease of toxin-antitoxin system
VIHLDTHVALWLYAGRLDLLSPTAREALDTDPAPTVSPMVLLEIQYLYEIGRVAEPSESVEAGLRKALGLRVCEQPFARVVAHALTADWTRDPFDRLIVSQAAVADADLVSRDGQIAEHYPRTVW